MKKIYLIRHGKTDTGYKDEKVCIGRKDVQLSREGEAAVGRLSGFFLREKTRNCFRENIRVIWSSPLQRCVKTAEILAEETGWNVPVQTVEELAEIDTGSWDGLTFREIRNLYPEEFRQRGEHLGSFRISGGETFQEAGERFYKAIYELLLQTDGDCLVVAHAGVIRAFLCLITGKAMDELMDYNIPCGSITELQWEEGKEREEWMLCSVGLLPVETMDEPIVENIWEQCGTTIAQQQHMIETAEFALAQIRDIPGFSLTDKKILYYSCLLHDMLRSIGRGHEKAAAEWLEKRGYLELVQPVGNHNNAAVYLPDAPLTIEEVLFYSDKRVKDAEIVSIEDRFEASRKRIRDEIGKQMHKERMLAALAIGQKIRKSRDITLSSLTELCESALAIIDYL